MENHFKRGFTRTTAVLFAALLLSTSAYVPQSVVPFVPTSLTVNAEVGDVIASGDYWTAYDLGENNYCKVVLNGKLTGTSGTAPAGATKLDWGSILTAIGSDYSLTEISAAENTQFVGRCDNMFHVKRTSSWQTNKLDTVKKIDLSNVDTAEATSMETMFSFCLALEEIDLSSFDTSNVTSLYDMFYGCKALKSVDMSNFDTSKVTGTNFAYIFSGCSSLESVNLTGWETSQATGFGGMFRGCTKLKTLDLSSFNMSNATHMQDMFNGCTSLETIIVGGGWTTEKATSHSNMFTNTTSLAGGNGTAYAASNPTDKTYAHVDGVNGEPGYFTSCYTKYDLNNWWWGVKADGTLELFGNMPDDIGPFNYNGSKYYSPWGTEGYWSRSNIKKIVALPGAKAGKNSLYKLFFNHTEVTEIDLSNLDVSNAENMFGVLQDCRKATTINLSGWDTSNVTNMGQMFYQCNAIKSLDLSHFKTSNVTDMQYMFSNCGLKSLNISNWDTSNVTNMFAMFSQSKLESTDDITGWANLDTSNVTNMQSMFNTSNFKKIDVSNFKTENVTNMQSMFSSCRSLESIVGLDKFDTSRLTDVSSMFSYCYRTQYDDNGNSLGNVTALKSVDLSSFNFTDNINKSGMFTSTDVESIKVNGTFATTDDWSGPRLSNAATNKFITGWFNENGEMISGTGGYAVISGQNGVLSRKSKDFTGASIADISDQIYTGEAIEPEVTVKDGETTLVKDTDYKVTYEDNTKIGTASVTVAGLGEYGGVQETTFDIAASITAPADANVVIYKSKTAVADKIDEKDAVKEGYYIVSDKQLTFDDNQIDVREYKPNASNHPFKNKDNWSKYCYYVLGLSDNVVASHSHIYKVQTAQNKLNVMCEGEPGGYETIAELTIAEGNYEYGDKVDIEAKTYAVDKYDVTADDVTFGSVYFKNKANTSTSTTSMPTDLGSYSAEIAAIFSKDSTRYSLYKEFEIGKKDISKLVKASVPTAEKNDHIEVSLKPSEGAEVPGYTVTYNGKQYTPVIKLVNYVYDYNDKKYKETELVEGTDYTAVITPQTNAGHYTVTINAKSDSVNYKGTGTFDWDITKRNFENLSVTDNRNDEQKIYDGQAVQESEFTVSGLGTDTNPGTTNGNTFTYKWYKVSDDYEKPNDITVENIPEADFVEMAQGAVPTDAGYYRVVITVKNDNYNDTIVAKNFEIVKKTVTITPKDDNNIVYGTPSPVWANLTFDAEGLVGTDTVTSADLDLRIADGFNADNSPKSIDANTILNAGEYDYVIINSAVASLPNYTFVLADKKFVVEKKALTKDMFTVSPTELTYNSKEQTVNVTASDSLGAQGASFELPLNPLSIELIKNTDWEIVDNTNKATNAGEYTVKVKATENGNYSGELTLDKDDQKWTINGKDVNSVDPDDPDNSMSVEALDKTYTGSDITETVTVKDGTTTLTVGTDYEIIIEPNGDKYSDAQSLTQKNAGTYTFYIKGIGNYSGEKKVTWKINPAQIVSAKLAGGTKIYDGKAVTEKDFRTTIKLLADDKAKDLTKTFVFKSDGTSVDNPTNAGIYTVELTVSDPKGNYATKTVTSTFEIKPREVEVYPKEGQTFEYGATISDIEDAINNPDNIDLEIAEEDSVTGIIAADNTADTMTTMFSDNPLTIANAGDGKVNVGYYDIVTKEDMDVVGNYKLVYEYPIQVEVTKATLKDDWFTLYIRDEDTNESAAAQYSESVTFNGKKIIVKANNGQQLVEGTDYTVNGTTEVYLPGEYSIDIKGKGNYKGTVTKTYKVDPNKDVHAKTVAPESSYNAETSTVVPGYTYDGNSPEVSVTEVTGSAPLPELSKVTYKYWQKNDQNEWEEIAVAPVDAGDYKVQGEVTAKGYEIEVDAAEFTIARKKIEIKVDSKDLTGVYGQGSYTVPYTYADDAIIDKDKAAVAITGDIVVNVGNSGAGEYELDYSGVTVNSDNYELVFPNGLKFVLSKKELVDDNIVFDNANVALHDIGTSTASFSVVVDGKTLVKDVDYTVAGTTEADEAGTYKVQILGKGNYVGFAEKAWTLADDPAARAAAQAVIAENVNVTLGDNMSAKLNGGKKRITATVNAAANDGYTITKAGFVYIPEADYVEGQLVIGGEGVTNAGRNNAASYTYGMIDNAGTGIYVRGYAVVNDGAYETVVYTDARKLVYDDLVRYTVTVVGGTIISNYPEDGFSGTQVKTDKPAVRISLDSEQIPEGQQFYCWEKNGVAVSYSESFSFAVPEKDSTINAVYVDADEEVEKQAATYIESVTPNKDTKKITFVSVANIPNDLTMIKTGIVATNDAAIGENIDVNSAVITDGCSVFVKELAGVTESTKNAKYSWTKSKVVEGQTWYVRSYVEYIDANNEHQILYGELIRANLDGIIG